jgi:lactoylglutathione lyase
VVIEIYPLPDDGTAVYASTRLGFAVGKLAEVVQAVETNGTHVVKRPTRPDLGFQAVVKDPDGRSVELSQKTGELQ